MQIKDTLFSIYNHLTFTASNSTVLADSVTPESDIDGGLISSLSGLMPIVLIFLVFYFLLIRPQEKKRREHKAMIESVKEGEHILTHSGIFAQVIKINSDNSVIIEIAKNCEVKITKAAVSDILSRKEQDAKEKVKNKKQKQLK